MKPKQWQPLSEEPFVQRANEAINDVLRDLEKIEIADGSLLRGAAGFALFYSYLSEARQDEAAQETAGHYIESAFSRLGELTAPSLYYGFPGVAFLLHHLRHRFEAPEDSLQELDQLLIEKLSSWHGEFDLLEGLVGLGVYAVERLPAQEASSCLSLVLSHLESLVTQTSSGFGWFTKPPFAGKSYPDGNFNLGVAHGSPAIIALLAKIIQHQFEPARAERLLRGAVSWLLAQEGTDGFPVVLAKDKAPIPSKPTWAYGDAGISICLLQAAKAVGEVSWEEAALRIALRATRFDPKEVQSAGLCQGTAGTGHIFLRLYQYTGRATFQEAALVWLTETLNKRTPKQGIGGFHSLVQPKLNDLDDIGFLTGAVGVALVLLSSISPIDPGWDIALFLS